MARPRPVRRPRRPSRVVGIDHISIRVSDYEDYYAVFFLDPDGIKLERMKYGELTAKRQRARVTRSGQRPATPRPVRRDRSGA